MGKFVTDEATERIEALMFLGWGDSPKECFLKDELRRYVPQLTGRTEDEIRDFVGYQKAVYFGEISPAMGRPIASLNPTFSDSIKAIKLSRAGHEIYTCASTKVNGYRLQLHRGVSKLSAFTRQFTPYDLRMFPELAFTLEYLPLMIGDAELCNRHHHHLAGFNRVQMRFPKGNKFWPKFGSDGLDQETLQEYLSDPDMFKVNFPFDGSSYPHNDLELCLCFHGLYAISTPGSWHLPRAEQAEYLTPLCQLPIDYRRIDSYLDQLEKFIGEKLAYAKVVERKVISSHKELADYKTSKEKAGEEGICIVQTVRLDNGVPVVGGRSIKVKQYETVDAALLGLYLKRNEDGLTPDNIIGALLGLYDANLGEFLPAMKVNLDPNGRQIKTDGQRKRLIALTQEIIDAVSGSIDPDGKVITVHDVFLKEGAYILKYLLGSDFEIDLEQLLLDLPRGHDLVSLLELYLANLDLFYSSSKKSKVAEVFIVKHLQFFRAVANLDKERQKRFAKYFGRAKEIKATSAKLIKPQIVLNMSKPIIVEARAFDLKYAFCQFPAGFHSWFMNSFQLTNCFAERVRYDKADTTDYATIRELCGRYTVRKRRHSAKSN